MYQHALRFLMSKVDQNPKSGYYPLTMEVQDAQLKVMCETSNDSHDNLL